jgi:hypothetical protein
VNSEPDEEPRNEKNLLDSKQNKPVEVGSNSVTDSYKYKHLSTWIKLQFKQ